MKERMREEVLERLDALAAKLGVAADQLWEVLLRQAEVVVYVKITWALFFVCVGVGLFFVGRWARGREERMRGEFKLKVESGQTKSWEHSPDGAFPTIMAVVLVVPTALVMAILTDIMTPLLNPEYWALRRLVHMMGGG